MEKDLERYYSDFKRPPFAPTYHPTEEEFADPISYVAKIRPEAQQFGLIKIIPPPSFRPPFCIDSAKFEFVPRVQRLNEVDALFRLRIIFINKLVHFWKYSKDQQFRIPYIDNKYIDLYRLRQLVEEEGGLKRVNDTRRWAHLAKSLGFRGNAGQTLKQCYTRWIHPFELSVANKEQQQQQQGESSTTKKHGGPGIGICRQKQKPQLNADDGCPSPSSSSAAAAQMNKSDGGSAAAAAATAECDGTGTLSAVPEEKSMSPLTRSQARMMAGTSTKTAVPSLDKSSIQAAHRTTPIELVMCGRCGGGDDEARLLLCETCDASMHTYCATPPLAVVPKGEWRCAQCVANAVRNVSMDFGFTDSNQCFTLDAFGEWANLFKQQYFNQAPCDVTNERVEREFWRNVIDIDKGVHVKYGADLISSKVGSGFPRREDVVRGVVDARERQQYANHPWNLNNLPKVRESVLCHMTTDISGMIVPWVYIGMLFSTFCWHVEDHWLYSINYNHWGERKVWYGVPGDEAELFDKVMKESAPELFVEQTDLLHQMITHMNPQFLVDRGVHVHTVHQNAGEFVITFPRSYHAGFNEGLNCAEAVNFAPPDWLKMGRLCLENYASVGRNCVFSHEELVMKMVFVAHKMSIGMCLATLDELSWIVGRETDFRRRLSAAGVQASVYCRFEDIPDDERSCAVCRTTLFCSGLCCQHEGRMVCAQHVHQLCNECSLEQCCLKFRYTLEDLVPLVRRLTERTTAFFVWRKAVAELYTTRGVEAAADGENGSNNNDMALPGEQHQQQQPEEDGDQKSMEMTAEDTQKKIDVVGMRSLADQWRTARFPHCEEIQRINQATAQFERTAVAVRKVLNRKIRLRDQTRCQKADTRWEYAEVHNLRQQLADSMFEDRELEDGIQELCQRVEGWKSRANAAFARPFAGIQTVDMLYALVSEAEEDFNVKMEAEGLDRLRAELARCQWLLKADQIVRRVERNTKVKSEGGGGTAPTAAEVVATRRDTDEDGTLQLKPEEAGRGESIGTIMEGGKAEPDEEEDEEQQKRVDLQALAKTIADGVRWCAQCATVQAVHAKLEQFLRSGTEADRRASDFLALAHQKAAPEAAVKSQIGAAAAATAVGFEEAQQQWHAIAVEEGELFGTDWIQSPAMDNFRAELKLAQLAYNDFELLSRNAFSLRNLEQLEHYFAQSLFERDGQRHGQLKVWLDRLQRFVERIRTIFQKAVSYYTMFDIVAGRSDLPALIEGEPMPLALFTSNKYSENWRQLRPFVSRDQLLGHLRSIADQQCTLLHALRLTNAGRSPKETCCCARDAQPALTRRQRSQCSAAAASRTNGRGGGGDDQHPRKRSSLPSRRRTGEAGGSAEISSPTMVVDGRRTTAALSSSSREEQQQQLQQQHREGEEDGQKAQQQADNHAGGGRGGTDRRLTTTTVNDMIPCFVCNASLHVACAQWDPFLARLPLGVLLCQRCLRSRRPCVEDVEAACYSSELPENCLERIVVQNLFHRSGDVFTQLQRLLHTIPKGTKQIEPNVETSLKKWLTMALSLEVTDIEVYNALANSAYFDLFPLPERQIQIWHHVRERMVDAEPLPFIFGHSIASSSSVASGGGGGGGSGRRTSNAGGKRRSSNNNNSNNNNINNSHHPNHSSIVANKSSCSSATSSSSLSFHAFASSPSKQRRRRASVDDNDGVSNSNGLEKHRAAMLLEKQQKDGKNGGGGGIDDDRTMEEESEEGTIDQQQQQQQNGGSGGGQMEKCAADFCLRPYSEFTRWIQCEAGCARWYHFCCVGISVRGAQRISAYCCYKCATAAEAVASSTSTAAQTALSTTTNTTIVVAAVAAIEQQQQPHSPHSSSAAATTTTTAAATAAAATV